MISRHARATHAILLAGMTLLAGCGQHPAAGEWLVSTEEPSVFSRIQIQSDGTAHIFASGREDQQLGCVWAGTDRSTIQLDCTLSAYSTRHSVYQLQVIGNRNSVLIDSGRVIGHYQRKPF